MDMTHLTPTNITKDLTLFIGPDGRTLSSLNIILNDNGSYRIEQTDVPSDMKQVIPQLSEISTLKEARKVLRKMSRQSGNGNVGLWKGVVTPGTVCVIVALAGLAWHAQSLNSSGMRNMAMMMASQGNTSDGGNMPGMTSAFTPGGIPDIAGINSAHKPGAGQIHVPEHIKQNGQFFHARTPVALPSAPNSSTESPSANEAASQPSPNSMSDVIDNDSTNDTENQKKIADQMNILKNIPDVLPGSDYNSYEDLKKVMPEKSH